MRVPVNPSSESSESGSTPEAGAEIPRSTDQSPLKDPWERYSILTCDGGGIRGLSSLLIIKELMNVIGIIERELDENATHSFYPNDFLPAKGSSNIQLSEYAHRYFPCHYFTVIAGTSTAIMLGRLRMSVEDCVEAYKRLGEEVFGHPRTFSIRGKKSHLQFYPKKDKFSVKPLRAAINRIVKERDPFQSSEADGVRVGAPILETPRGLCQTMIWAVEGTSNRNGWVFRSFPWPRQDNHRQRNRHTHTYEISMVATATTAAPTYFKPTKHGDLRFFDGGMTANNPCRVAVEEICDYLQITKGRNPEDKGYLGAIVSIGTGKTAKKPAKQPKWWLGRYGEAIEWQKRCATNSSDIHREMCTFADNTADRLASQPAITSAPAQFSYARFNVGCRHEPPDDKQDLDLDEMSVEIGKLAGMKMDEWVRNAKPSDSTVSKIESATSTYLSSPLVKRKMREVAEILVLSRRRRSQSDRLADRNQPLHSACALRWYRYSSAIEWECQRCRERFYSKQSVVEHLKNVHKEDFRENSNAQSEPCGNVDPQQARL